MEASGYLKIALEMSGLLLLGMLDQFLNIYLFLFCP